MQLASGGGWSAVHDRSARALSFAERERGATIGPFCPIAPNVAWAAGFEFDQTADGGSVKILNVVDEFTREALSTRTERSIDADLVVATLDKIADEWGFPASVRFDHGPEFVAYAVAVWCRFNATETIFIDPGSPWQTGSASPSTAVCATST